MNAFKEPCEHEEGRIVKKVSRAVGKDKRDGWSIDPGTINSVRQYADGIESVSMEQVEAVICAMVDLGYSVVKVGDEG